MQEDYTSFVGTETASDGSVEALYAQNCARCDQSKAGIDQVDVLYDSSCPAIKFTLPS